VFRSRIVATLGIGAAAVIGVGGSVVAAGAVSSSSVKACVNQSGGLRLLSDGRCPAHAHKVSLGATGPSGLGPLYSVYSADPVGVSTTGTPVLAVLSLPAGDFQVISSGSVQEGNGARPDGVNGTCLVAEPNSKPSDPGVALTRLWTP
jgi:hypothetical protein